MERKLASIVVIDDLQPIEGADLIEVATVKGWKLVVKNRNLISAILPYIAKSILSCLKKKYPSFCGGHPFPQWPASLASG